MCILGHFNYPIFKIPGLDITTLTQTEEVTLYDMRLFIVIVY